MIPKQLKKIHIEHIGVFLAGFLIPTILFSYFTKIQFTDALWGFLLLQALIVTGFYFVLRKKHAKAGHVPLIVGLYLIILGGGMFFGSLKYSQVNQYGEQVNLLGYWQLSNTEAGIFIVTLIIGIVMLMYGLKVAFQNVYFWTWKAYAALFGSVAVIGIIIYTIIPK